MLIGIFKFENTQPMFDDFEDGDPEEESREEGLSLESALIKYSKLHADSSIYFTAEEIEDLSYYFGTVGRFDDQLHILNHGLYLYPERVNFLLEKANLLLLKSHLPEAEELVKKAKEHEPYNSIIYQLEAEIFFQAEQYNESEKSYRQALEFADKSDEEMVVDLYRSYSEMLIVRDGLKDANQKIEEALLIFPDNLVLVHCLLNNFNTLMCLDEGAKYFEHKINENPYSFNFWFCLGKLQELRKDYKKALHAFEYASLVDENQFEPYYRMGNLHEMLEEYEKAIENYLKYKDITGEEDVCLYLARCYIALEDNELARYYLEKLNYSDNSDPELYYLMGYSLLDDNKPLRALHYFNKAYSIDKEQFLPLKGIFTCYIEMNRVESIAKLFDKLLVEDFDILHQNWKDMANILYLGGLDREFEDFIEKIEKLNGSRQSIEGVYFCIKFDREPSEINKEHIFSRMIQDHEDIVESVRLFCPDLYESESFQRLAGYYDSDYEQ